MKLSNKVYDVLKWVAIMVLPALATFVGTVGLALSYQYTDVAVTIIVATGTFLGAILGVSNYGHNKGDDNNAK